MDTTLETLTTMVAALQRQINDLSVELQGHENRISGHDTDIHTLQDPPIGVPPEFLSWLSSHSIREVDTILDTDLTTLSTDVADNASDVSDLSSRLDQETTDRLSADTDLASTDTDLQSQIDTNLATLNQEITDRGTLSVTVADGLDTVNTRVDDLEANLALATESASTSSGSFSSQIGSINSALQTALTQIDQLIGNNVDPLAAQAAQITSLTTIANDAASDVAQEITDRKSADTVLQNSFNSLSSSIAGITDTLNDEKTAREAADLDIQSDVAALTAEIAGHQALIDAETAARIAADNTLTTGVADNSADIIDNANNISDEITNRENANTLLQGNIDTNTAAISANSSLLSTHDTKLTAVNSRFSVVKDGGGYVTGYRVIDESNAAASFNLKDLNNNVRLQNPGYVGKYFPPVSVSAFTAPIAYDTLGGSNDFHGTDGNNYTRPYGVYATQTVATNGSCFKGVDYSTGGDLNRLGQVLTTFKVDFSGKVDRYLSLWYRIKNAPADVTQKWFPVALADNTPDTGYTFVRGQAVMQISVASDKVIEFGLSAVNTLDAQLDDVLQGFIYGGSVSITALNMVTIS